MAQNLIRIHKIKIIYGGTKCYTLLLEKLQQESLITIEEYISLKTVSLRQIRDSVASLIESLQCEGEDCCRRLITCLKQDNRLRPFFPCTLSRCVKKLAL
ncbi:hypothetical protein KM759_gp126 [Lymphocystis disease virus 4]|uniref:CARD domain-containing protein n=1 Tax=Lymphocystis disease virus 4 TaxID=2704413 RepID=A0A6B9XN15_9VIRU|nr:hypothetical protein KM759_gp126 [Lymphocystis disease virus 4]QHR78558.1 hypothetical protein [Lymphocystis disease virus 4]